MLDMTGLVVFVVDSGATRIGVIIHISSISPRRHSWYYNKDATDLPETCSTGIATKTRTHMFQRKSFTGFPLNLTYLYYDLHQVLSDLADTLTTDTYKYSSEIESTVPGFDLSI